MNKNGVVLSGLVYVLLIFFLMLIAGMVFVMWHRHHTIEKVKDDANEMFEESYTPITKNDYEEQTNKLQLV